MDDFLTGAGCVVKVRGKSGSAFKIDGWSDIIGQVDTGLITIDSIDPSENDIAVPVVATDNFRILYRFGENFGNLRVTGTIYLGTTEKGQVNSAVMEKLQKGFKDLRLSSKKDPVKVSISDGYTCKAYFIGLSIGGADPMFHKMTYTLVGLIAPKPKGNK